MADDCYPRLRWDMPDPFVVARAEGWVLLGGLGVMGVGQMWQEERPDHAEYEGYAEAPIVDPPEKPYGW